MWARGRGLEPRAHIVDQGLVTEFFVDDVEQRLPCGKTAEFSRRRAARRSFVTFEREETWGVMMTFGWSQSGSIFREWLGIRDVQAGTGKFAGFEGFEHCL